MNESSPEYARSLASRSAYILQRMAAACLEGTQKIAYTHYLPPADCVAVTSTRPIGLSRSDLRALQKLSRSPDFDISIEIWLRQDRDDTN